MLSLACLSDEDTVSTGSPRFNDVQPGDPAATNPTPTARSTVVLVGLMGAGKSSVGRRLAVRLGLPFIDADEEIEKSAGMTIPEIFARHGEAAFRDGERRIIARLLEGSAHVLATGGGAFIDPVTRARIRAAAVTVWLRADLAALLRRVKRRTDRPLLQQGEPATVMAELMARRYPIYAEADITVDTDDAAQEVIVAEICRQLEARAALAGAAGA